MGGCSSMCDDATIWWRKAMGKLSTRQQFAYVLLVVAGVCVNVFYLNYLLKKVARSRDSPVSVLSVESVQHFPSYVLYGQSTCPIHNVTCQLTDSNEHPLPPIPGSVCGIMSWTAEPFPINQQFVVLMPGSGWVAPTPDREGSIEFRVTAHPSNWTVDPSGLACVLYYYLSSYDDQRLSGFGGDHITPFTAHSGDVSFISLSATADEYLESQHSPAPTPGSDPSPNPSPLPGEFDNSVVYHVESRSQLSEDLGSLIDIEFTTQPSGTSFDIDWNRRENAFGLTDLMASFSTVLGLTVSIITWLFPRIPLVTHERVWVLDTDLHIRQNSIPNENRKNNSLLPSASVPPAAAAAGSYQSIGGRDHSLLMGERLNPPLLPSDSPV